MVDNISAQGATSAGRPAYGTRQTTQTVLATSGLHTWAQQCLTFELSESVGVLGTGGNRAIRISSKGTVINAAQYRGEGMALAKDPLSRGVTGHLAWILGEEAKSATSYTSFALEDFYLSLEVVSPNHTGDSSCPGEDWYLSDISPTTKINDVAVSTSTSSGFNIGLMGDAPTVGYDESNTKGRDWTLPDYALLAVAGHDAKGAPHGAWHIKRSDPAVDSQIANSSLSPDLELVFTLRPGAPARRFTSIAANMTVSFQDTPPQESEDEKDTKTWEKRLKFYNPMISPLLSRFEGEISKKPDKIKIHSFLVNYIVDWHTGEIFAKTANNAEHSPIPASELIVISEAKGKRKVLEEYAEDRKRLNRGFGNASLTAQAAKDYLAQPIAAQKALDLPMSFDQGSMMGVASAFVGNSDDHIDLLFPAYFSEDTASAFRIYSGFFDQKQIDASGSSWLPFKNAVRIPPQPTKQLLWCAPAGRTSGRVVGLTVGDGGKGVGQCNIATPMAALGSRQVPLGLYAPGDRNIALWLDHIYDYRNGRDQNGSIEIWPSSTGTLEKAAFTDNLSIGISNGTPVFSKDFFKRTESKSKFKNIRFISEDKTKDTRDLYDEISKILSSSFRYSIFSLFNTIIVFFDSSIALIKAENKEKITFLKLEMEGQDRLSGESFAHLSGDPHPVMDSDFLWHIQQLAIRFSQGSDITGVVLRGFGSIRYDGNFELVITER